MKVKLRKRYIIIPFTLLVFGLMALAGYLLLDVIRLDSFGTDFISYWSSGRLLLNGENPYSVESIMSLQQSAGWTREDPLIMYSPPWLLPFILPFCIGNFLFSKSLWLLLMVGLVFICTFWLWNLYGGGERNRYWCLVALSIFSPFHITLFTAQIVPLELVGLVGFLYFEEKKQWWTAAVFSTFLTLKPQTLYLFWIALFFWIIEKKNWAFAGQILVVNLSIVLIPMLFNLQVYDQYLGAIAGQSFAYKWATPTIGTYLRLIFGGENDWLQFVPMVAGILWLLFYWSKKRKQWEWKQEIPWILFFSLITTFYCWGYDYILILVALIQMIMWMTNQVKVSTKCKITIILYLLVNVLAMTEHRIYSGEYHFIWFPPTLLFLFYFARKVAGIKTLSYLDAERPLD